MLPGPSAFPEGASWCTGRVHCRRGGHRQPGHREQGVSTPLAGRNPQAADKAHCHHRPQAAFYTLVCPPLLALGPWESSRTSLGSRLHRWKGSASASVEQQDGPGAQWVPADSAETLPRGPPQTPEGPAHSRKVQPQWRQGGRKEI